MPLLPPHHHPLPIAAVYIVASVLKDAHTADARPEGPSPFTNARLSVRTDVPVPPQTGRLPLRRNPPPLPRFLVCTDLRVEAGHKKSGLGVAITFREADGRPFYEVTGENASGSITSLVFFLQPPAIGCLSSERLKASLNSIGLVSLTGRPPESLRVSAPSFEERAVTRYRQALALGLLEAVLFDKDGIKAPIPADFWRRDEAVQYLTENRLLTLEIAGQPFTGRVIADVARLGVEWRRAFRNLPASAVGAESVFDMEVAAETAADLAVGEPLAAVPGEPPSLGVFPDFMTHAGRTLGIVGGKGPGNLPIHDKYLCDRLEWLWDSYKRENKGELTKGVLVALSKMLRHQDEHPGGRRKAYAQLDDIGFKEWKAERKKRLGTSSTNPKEPV